MKENYVFPAKFTETNQGHIDIMFLDFPEIIAQADSMEDAVRAAQEALALTIIAYCDENRDIPEPTPARTDAVYIHIWMPLYKNKAKEVYVRKSVTIPEWLDILAKESSINYSAALVKGIKAELGIED